VLLRDLIWEVFESTGYVDAYLLYRSCPKHGDQPITSSDHKEIIAPIN